MKLFIFDKVPEKTLKLPVKGNCILLGRWYAAIFDSPPLAKLGQACQNMIMGFTLKQIHKMKRHDSIFDGQNSIKKNSGTLRVKIK